MVRSYPLIPMGGENKLHGVVALEILNNIWEFKKNLWLILDFGGRSVKASNRLRANSVYTNNNYRSTSPQDQLTKRRGPNYLEDMTILVPWRVHYMK